jgi:glycosyltransferase involved in cell wall biosynthesis
MTELPFLILIPIYNDWEAVSLLLPKLDLALSSAGLGARVVLVDDGSTLPAPANAGSATYEAIETVEVLELRRNIGHQRAIAVALAWAEDRVKPRAVLVMDGDGEDAPEDVPRLIAKLGESGGTKVIFAERTRRSETPLFRAFYNLYRLVHVLLTGIPVRVGNFSVVPARQLTRLVVVSELWNHYAAAVFKARLPRDVVPTSRATRLSGLSRMNFVSHFSHGLSALSVHAELIGVRLTIMTGVLLFSVCVLLGVVLTVRMATPLAIPGWATTAAGILVIVLLQGMALLVVFVFIVLHGRSQPLFIPLRDYPYFVAGVRSISPHTLKGSFGQMSGPV